MDVQALRRKGTYTVISPIWCAAARALAAKCCRIALALGLSNQMNSYDRYLRSLLGNSLSGLKIEILLVATTSVIVILQNDSYLPNLVLISLGGLFRLWSGSMLTSEVKPYFF